MNELTIQFQKPGVAWRGKPFWSWNGELREGELLRQVQVMHDMGLGGFFMHSRTGLVTEYLGDEWFRLTNRCAEEAERLGMEAWLYDEDRWPSGTAGGMVTANPGFAAQYLCLRTCAGTEFVWQDDLVAAFACDLNELAYTRCEQITPDTPKGNYADKTILMFRREPMAPSSFYNGNTYVDTLNLAATEHYITLTHDKYKEHCGEHLGKSIRGIFTDEPHRGAAWTGFGLPNEDRLWMTPWTDDLPRWFQAQFGTDIIEQLPELFLMPQGESIRPVKWQYMETLQQMFLANFARPLYDWCNAHQMQLTGHVLHEDSLTAQAAMQGSLMRFYELMHAPGVDVLTEGNRNYVIVKQLTSAARQLGQTWLLSELYGCSGWQMSFESHKATGDWQALFGINLRCHHLSWYTMEGEAKRDYPASILHQSAWWRDYAYVETYFARLGLLLTQGRPCCDLLVLNPIESVWCRVRVGWAEGLSPQDPDIIKTEQQYAQLSAWLLGAHLDYDYGDEEMLGRLAAVGQDADGTPVLRVGEASYRAVVAGGMTTMRRSTLRLLTEFAQAGGQVIFAGDAPAFVDVLPSEAARDLAKTTTQIGWDEAAVVSACRGAVRNAVTITHAETGEALSEVYCQLRRDADTFYLIAVNVSTTEPFRQARVTVQGQGQVTEWDCRTGARYAVPSRSEGGFVTFDTQFAPSGERAWTLAPTQSEDLATRPDDTEIGQSAIAGPFAYTLGEDNVCVLDMAAYQIGDGPRQDALEVLKIDRAVRAELGLALRGGEMVQPWFAQKYEAAPAVLAPLSLQFEFDIDALPDTPVYLCLERAAQWTLTLNGRSLPSAPDGWWVDTAFEKILVPADMLALGRNMLTLDVPFHAHVNIEAVYLVGAFGVQLDGTRKTLSALPAQVMPTDLAVQGMPFYGGSITYHVPLPLDAKNGQCAFVTTPAFEAACVKVLAPNGEAQMIAWQPYRAQIDNSAVQAGTVSLEVVLTRRNTFGPLHQVPLRTGAYGPGNFVTAGDDFSVDYMLYPAGLLQAPVISWTAPASAEQARQE